jgi:hypothetical protein
MPADNARLRLDILKEIHKLEREVELRSSNAINERIDAIRHDASIGLIPPESASVMEKYTVPDANVLNRLVGQITDLQNELRWVGMTPAEIENDKWKMALWNEYQLQLCSTNPAGSSERIETILHLRNLMGQGIRRHDGARKCRNCPTSRIVLGAEVLSQRI